MILNVSVIGILRGIDADFFGEVMQVSFEAGLQAIEVTMNTEGAEEIISSNRGRVPVGKYLGMGTVRNIDEAEKAIKAGAMFLVTPNFNVDVIQHAKSRGIPVVAGALTPTEVHGAWSAGADMVKVFPCGAMGGPQYITELRGPFDHIPLAAVGGVSASNVADYFSAGVTAVGVGASLFGRRALREKNLKELSSNVREFMQLSNNTFL